ncbi:enoyl-CoA hydratase/isomerase family protein [Streptomyces albus subsp. chlorinus]|uniref:enoyl-CoA hydratase-related protein n=1 Tax=Streptomyces albus TaxID=1888 RepID=UPI00156E1809|nr:enoyl-CoA hydratase/isomerase family protein [Streptomyces albus subsp. chlorinus]
MIGTFKNLRVEQRGPVLAVELACPETGNTVTEALLDDLLGVLTVLPDLTEVRAVVLSGAGPDFCLGGDRREIATMLSQDATGAGVRVSSDKARRVCEALSTTGAVTIAQVRGQVIGAGLALVLHCDLRVGAENCRFRLPELALGMPLAWGGALPRLLNEVGAARARELILTCRAFGAVEAERLAVLHRVVPEAELDAAVEEWVRPIVRRSPAALRVTKSLLNSYAAATRLADPALLDAELMASVLASRG